MNLASKSTSKCHSQVSEIDLRTPPQNHPKGDLPPKLHFHNKIVIEINDFEGLLRIQNSEVEIRNPLVKEPAPKQSQRRSGAQAASLSRIHK